MTHQFRVWISLAVRHLLFLQAAAFYVVITAGRSDKETNRTMAGMLHISLVR